MRRGVSGIVSAAVVVCFSTSAWGGGFEHPDNGTVAEGRAGAFTARASDGSAFHYNPAGLAGQHGTNVMLLSNFTDLHACFTRDGTYPTTSAGGYGVPPDTRYDLAGPMCDSHGLFENIGPMLTFSTDLGNRKLPVFGIGLWGPSSLIYTGYSQNGEDADNQAIVTFQQGDRTRAAWAPNRFDLVDNQLDVIYISPTIAYEVVRGLRLGAQFQWIYSRFEFTNYGVISAGDPGGASARNHLVVTDVFTPAFQIGAQYQLGRYLQFGALFRWIGSYDATGDLDLAVSHIDRTDVEHPKEVDDATGSVPAHLIVDNASSLRLGARFLLPRGRGPNERTVDDVGYPRDWDPLVDEVFDVEFDYVFEANSAIDEFKVTSDKQIHLQGEGIDYLFDPIGEMHLPHNYKDTHSFRLGGDWNILPGRLAGRLGLGYETATSPVDTTLLDFPAFARLSTHVGATVRLGPADISLAYAHIFSSDRHVRAGTGEGRVVGPDGACDPGALDADNAAVCRTNEGDYEASYDIVSLGVQGRF